MSSRISKQKKLPHPSTVRKNDLLAAVLCSSLSMPSCSACLRRGAQSCEVSSSDSSRCSECVDRKLPHCDVLGVSPAQLRHIASQHQKLESELEEAEMKVMRLRKQKKLWFEKMMRAVSRGIDNVEELERVEKEEAAREAARQAVVTPDSLPRRSSTEGQLDSDFMATWDAVYEDVPLDPSLLVDFGVVGGTPQASSGNA